jgi:type II secretion system protein G
LIELLVAMVIIGILSVMGISNFMSSQMKARDAQRKSDLQNLSKSLEMYYNDKGAYPLADNGKVLGIEWGSDQGFTDTSVTGGAVYMVKMPKDPSGGSYYYVSETDGTGYRLYALLENTKDSSVVKDENGVATTYDGTECGGSGGTAECNYEITSSNLSL